MGEQVEQSGVSYSHPIRNRKSVLELRNVSIYYDENRAVKDVSFNIRRNRITAIIGPSGCGKSTLLRSINRMNDFVEGARVEGELIFANEDLYGNEVDAVEVRRRIGMVFQKPNPFPKSIYNNITWGPLNYGYEGSLDELVERSLKQAALWDEVKGRLHESALNLSGGQQQRL